MKFLVPLVVWILLLAGDLLRGIRLSLIDLLLTFGIAFVVPLNLARLRSGGLAVPGPAVVAGGSCLAVASFLLAPGVPASLLTVPWLLVSLWVALRAGLEFLTTRQINPARLLPTASLVYLLVGAGWLSLSRFGLRPLGLSDNIVELTAVHFHFAGFGGPLFALATAQVLQAKWPGRASFALTAEMGVVAAMPVVAIGFFAPPLVAGAGALLLAISLWVLSLLMMPAATLMNDASKALLLVAAVAVIVPMALGLEYAAGPIFGLPVLSIAQMARFHGAANAFGFSACTTLAFFLNDRIRTSV